MIVEIHARTPTALTKRQKELLKEFDEIEETKNKGGDSFFKKLFQKSA